MTSVTLVFFVLLLVAGSLAKDGNTTLSCFSVERNALLKFKASFSDPLHKLWSWNSLNPDCCKWYGVQCDKMSRYIIGVNLRNELLIYEPFYEISLYGKLTSQKLDPSIMELKNLRFLDLSGNDFQLSYIPASIETLNQLQYLNLSHANFSGFVPHQLGNLTRLSVLDLSFNGDYYHQLKVDAIPLMTHLSSLTHLDMSFVNIISTKDLLKVLNMLPSIVFLSLQNCGLGNKNLQHMCVINSTTFLPNIKYLDLSGNSFKDGIPCFLENMTSLRDLDLSSTSFQWTSAAYKFIQNKFNLESLNLGYNSFLGDISNFFHPNSSKCLGRKLVKLDLIFNYFYGQLPEEVGGFTKLEYLDLSENNISGPIPTSISNLSALKKLSISGNKLNGSIPSCFGNLTSLRYLDLGYNQLSGEIPTSLGQLQNLEYLWIGINYFNGKIFESHFANLSKLQWLSMGHDFTKLRVKSDWAPPFQLRWLQIESCEIEGGQFPKWLQTQKELTTLVMPSCSIEGAIPDWLWPKNLTRLFLSNNHIEGSLPESLCEMNSLRSIDLSKNRLSGYLFECLAKLTGLFFINLSSNRFSGVIPNSIGGAYSLKWLQLSNNSFTGELPSSLRYCTNLSGLDVGNNKLSGGVPKWIGKYLLTLEHLRLNGNDFYGTIPLELCQLSRLKLLDLANNKLTGNIPCCFGNFLSMQATAPVGSWFKGFSIQEVMKGVEMEYSSMLRYVAIMDLSNNALVGDIPLELTRLDALNNLNLSHNHLQGMIPGTIGRMKSMESLDLSSNNLFGNIPVSLSDLDFLGFLNLSNNNLSGKIPTGGHLETLDDPWRYEGNPGLCGASLSKTCNVGKVSGTQIPLLKNDEEEHKVDRIWFYGVVISGFAMGFWAAIGVLIFKQSWRFAYFKFADDIIGVTQNRKCTNIANW